MLKVILKQVYDSCPCNVVRIKLVAWYNVILYYLIVFYHLYYGILKDGYFQILILLCYDLGLKTRKSDCKDCRFDLVTVNYMSLFSIINVIYFL